MSKLVNSSQLSEIINIPAFTIRQYARERRIPCYKVGKQYLYDPDEVVSSIKQTNKVR